MTVAVIAPATELESVKTQEDLELDLDIEPATKVSVNLPTDTFRATEYAKVIAIVQQAQFVMASFEAVQGSEDPDKEWKLWLKQESYGDLTPRQAEKLIFLAEAVNESLPTLRQFSVNGLMEWSQLPGTEVRGAVLAIAESELMEYLTAKEVKVAYGIYQVENSSALPESLKKELNTLSGPPRVKVRKAAASYVKAVEALEGSSEEIEEALKASLTKRIKEKDILAALKSALPDVKAVKGLLAHTEQLDDVESIITEGLKEDCLGEAAKLVDTDIKRNLGVREVLQLGLDLEGALTELKSVKSVSIGAIADEVARSGKRNNFKLKMKDNQVLHVQLELFSE